MDLKIHISPSVDTPHLVVITWCYVPYLYALLVMYSRRRRLFPAHFGEPRERLLQILGRNDIYAGRKLGTTVLFTGIKHRVCMCEERVLSTGYYSPSVSLAPSLTLSPPQPLSICLSISPFLSHSLYRFLSVSPSPFQSLLLVSMHATAVEVHIRLPLRLLG